jgi:rhamnosyltransferase
MANLTQQIGARMPKVLILLATFNGAEHITEQLISLARQRDVAVSVLLSDDGSIDDTVERSVRTAETCGLDLAVLPPAPPSGSAGRNFFRLFRDADVGGYDFVALCDQDDIWLDDKLARACRELVRTNADAYSCNSVAFWPQGSCRDIKKNYPQRSFDYLFESASQGCTYVLSSATATRFKELLGTRVSQVEHVEFHDWLIYAWARTNGLHWHMDSAQTIRYRQSEHNVIGANAGFAALVERLSRMRAGWLSNQSLQIAECIGMANHPLVIRLRRFAWRDRLSLALQSQKFRRRPRDQLVFFLACLTVGI